MKKILITGGAGFIGSAIIQTLQKNGHEVFVIDNLSFGSRKFAEVPDSHFFEADILNFSQIKDVILDIQPHWVIHLAAIHFIPYCNKNPLESSQINVKGTINILEALKLVENVEKVFFASTAAVYPIRDYAVSENEILEPLDIYGLSKLVGEHLINEFYLQTGIPSIICRFFNAFGPNETNPHLIPEIQNQVNAGLRTIKLGNLDPKRDFIHTADMARAAYLLLSHFEKGIDTFNLGSGQEYSVLEVVKAFERQIGETIDIEVDEARVRKVERMHLLADISKLSSFVDWKPEVSLDEGIKTLVQTSLAPI